MSVQDTSEVQERGSESSETKVLQSGNPTGARHTLRLNLTK